MPLASCRRQRYGTGPSICPIVSEKVVSGTGRKPEWNISVLFSAWPPTTLADGPRIAGLNITVGPDVGGHVAGTSSDGSGFPFRKVMVCGTVVMCQTTVSPG